MADSFVVSFRDRSKRSAKLPHQANATFDRKRSSRHRPNRNTWPSLSPATSWHRAYGQAASNRQPHPQAKGLTSAGRIMGTPAAQSKQQRKSHRPRKPLVQPVDRGDFLHRSPYPAPRPPPTPNSPSSHKTLAPNRSPRQNRKSRRATGSSVHGDRHGLSAKGSRAKS
jgi:hypothetical protein